MQIWAFLALVAPTKYLGISETWSQLATWHSLMPLSQASPTPPHLKRGSYEKPPSPPSPALKPSYSQIVKMKKPPCDPGAMARAPAMKGSQYREVPGSIPTKDNSMACDPGNLLCTLSRDPLPASAPRDQSHDLTWSHDSIRPRDQAHYGRATNPLIGVWKTVGRSTDRRDFPGDSP